MPMGDSITHGLDVPGGYRRHLYDIITGYGYQVNFIGNQLQRGDSAPDPYHWGRPSWGIAQTDSIIGGKSYESLQVNESPFGSL